MEPGLGDREWLGGVLPHDAGLAAAAMEPGLGDREWPDRSVTRRPQVEPQWSPVLETGNGVGLTPRGVGRGGAAMEPGLGDREWGLPRLQSVPRRSGRNGARSWRPGMGRRPLRSCGRTSSRNGARSWRPGMADLGLQRRTSYPEAAMEPGLGDREWLGPYRDGGRVRPPQWSPVLETGNGPSGPVGHPHRAAPQWSPVLETGNGRIDIGRRRLLDVARRNGARSWRPGMVDPSTVQPERYMLPQWSPVLETGNGLRYTTNTTAYRLAAMEPGLGDREWRTRLSVFCASGPICRNGARSWRPGMAIVLPIPDRFQPLAAMEPGLGDREWSYPYVPGTLTASAAMEPGLGDREWLKWPAE